MNHYEVLGLPQSASQEEIRSAYIAQVKFFHPDVFPGDPMIAKVKTLQLNAAYSVLRDPVRRAEYDQRLSGAKNPPPSYSDTNVDFNNNPPRHSNESKSKKFRRSMVILSVLCMLITIISLSDGSSMNYRSGDSDTTSESQISPQAGNSTSDVPSDVEHSVPIFTPPNGQILYSNGGECIAPFSVVTRGSNNYYVKLKDAFDAQDAITLFVRGGETAEIDVPLGTYTLYYATGGSWQGEEDLFGDSTRYFKADELFEFYESDGYVNGWTVELYTQSNGNLSTESIDPSEF